MNGVTDELVMVDFEHAALVSVVQGTLEVFCDLLLAKLLLHAVDNGHDSLDVFVKNVTLLQ